MISERHYLELMCQLEDQHAIFYQLWRMGRPVFSDEVPTAAVSFDMDRQFLAFQFNPQFWERLSTYDRLFVIAHEALHVLLKHGLRGHSIEAPAKRRRLNIVMDVVVNHMLIRHFGFRRELLDPVIAEEGCFKDTVFGHDHGLLYDHFEHIYRHLQGADDLEGLSTLDDHSELRRIPEEVVDDLLQRAGRDMSSQEKQEVNDACRDAVAGDEEGSAPFRVVKADAPNNDAWLDVIDNWVARHSPTDRVEERWDRRPRRLQSLRSGFFLPREVEHKSFDKVDLTIFVDTSGSCRREAKRFVRCLNSIPREHFDVSVFGFDTRVYPIDPNAPRLGGFGGTYFRALEIHLQDHVRGGGDYPHTIFVLTDGYGGPFGAKYPERWHWFLTDGGHRRHIPEASKVYDLAAME